MPYAVSIDTSAYKPRRFSERNWEPGLLNSQMRALGAFKSTERSLRQLRWRINMFLSGCGIIGAVDDCVMEKYAKWAAHPKNTIHFFDEGCKFERTMRPECPGFHQGYYNIENALAKLEKDGVVDIPFSAAYDSRQYDKRMNGCFMRIIKK